MTTTELLTDPKEAWTNLVRADESARLSTNNFLRLPSRERIDRIRDGLKAGGSQRMAAVRVFSLLTDHEKQSLFPQLLRLASSVHGLTQKFRDLICALPLDWVIQRIKVESEPLLEQSTAAYQFEEYRRLLELYAQLGNRQLVEQLARRALAHSDEDVREAGAEFLDRVQIG